MFVFVDNASFCLGASPPPINKSLCHRRCGCDARLRARRKIRRTIVTNHDPVQAPYGPDHHIARARREHKQHKKEFNHPHARAILNINKITR
jgi:hypothetical protein